jgi:ADP-ribosyl-[dinitrogen reductase] hydrolase
MNEACSRVLLGTAVGDSLGLPAEGMNRKAIQRQWPGPWKHRLVFGYGMISDDTEHTVFVTQCLIEHSDDITAFQKALSWKLRWWLLGVPAGVGFATLRSILKLWIGFTAKHSGVFSAGNGPAMRSAIIGTFFAATPEKITPFVKASTRLTHTDPKAETAALAVAFTAAYATSCPPHPDISMLVQLRKLALSDKVWTQHLDLMLQAMEARITVSEYADALGLEKSISGYAYHTVPVALYAWWLHYGDFEQTVEEVIRCGGDTDTVAAIAGALAAINAPPKKPWVQGIRDYPISFSYLSRLGKQADTVAPNVTQKACTFPWIVMPIRNLLFFCIVLFHGFRRLVP